MDKKVKECCICSLEYIGYGNNAAPVKEGRCCDECNSVMVVPVRIGALMNMTTKSDKRKNNE
jgi:hypothetical protein